MVAGLRQTSSDDPCGDRTGRGNTIDHAICGPSLGTQNTFVGERAEGRSCGLTCLGRQSTRRSIRHASSNTSYEPYEPAMSLTSCGQLRRGYQMATDETNASKLIDKRIRELGDWRGETLSKVRGIIKEADPDIVEEWKWVKPTNPGTPVWSHNGGICTGESYKNVVKLTFFRGAALNDPSGLFNSSLEGKVRRAIDIREDDTIDEGALKSLIREAVAMNLKSKEPSA